MTESCKQCGWDEIICASCHGQSGLRGWVHFSLQVLKDLEMN
jgi:hypothetical protein